MAEDYYATLGVRRDASQAEIEKAYRELARKFHPDLHPDDKTAKDKFKQVQAAFDVLNDPSQREMYDRYGSSFQNAGAGGPRGGWSGPSPGGEDIDFSQFFGERFGSDPSGGFSDIFSQFRRASGQGRKRKSRSPAQEPGADVHSEVEVPFQTAIVGGKIEIHLQRESGAEVRLSVTIPKGIVDGGKIRIRGQGEPGSGGGPAGDLLLTVRVLPHPWFHRRDNHLVVKLPLSLTEAVLGAKVDVPTPRGTISLRVPPRTSSGAKLRAKGYGVAPAKGPPGDLVAEVQIMLPPEMDEAALESIRRLDSDGRFNPRAELSW